MTRILVKLSTGYQKAGLSHAHGGFADLVGTFFRRSSRTKVPSKVDDSIDDAIAELRSVISQIEDDRGNVDKVCETFAAHRDVEFTRFATSQILEHPEHFFPTEGGFNLWQLGKGSQGETFVTCKFKGSRVLSTKVCTAAVLPSTVVKPAEELEMAGEGTAAFATNDPLFLSIAKPDEGAAHWLRLFTAEVLLHRNLRDKRLAAQKSNNPHLAGNIAALTPGLVCEDVRNGSISYSTEYIHSHSLEHEELWNERQIGDGLLLLLQRILFIREQLGIMHGDIKPQNLLIDKKRRLWLIDFGLAGGAGIVDKGIEAAGTPGFVAPEQLQGHASDTSDAFSAAATMYYMLTKEFPIPSGMSVMEIQEWHAGNNYPDFSVIKDANLREVIEQLMRKDPKERGGLGNDMENSAEARAMQKLFPLSSFGGRMKFNHFAKMPFGEQSMLPNYSNRAPSRMPYYAQQAKVPTIITAVTGVIALGAAMTLYAVARESAEKSSEEKASALLKKNDEKTSALENQVKDLEKKAKGREVRHLRDSSFVGFDRDPRNQVAGMKFFQENSVTIEEKHRVVALSKGKDAAKFIHFTPQTLCGVLGIQPKDLPNMGRHNKKLKEIGWRGTLFSSDPPEDSPDSVGHGHVLEVQPFGMVVHSGRPGEKDIFYTNIPAVSTGPRGSDCEIRPLNEFNKDKDAFNILRGVPIVDSQLGGFAGEQEVLTTVNNTASALLKGMDPSLMEKKSASK